MKFILNGCDISFIAEASEDITLKQLIKQCDKINQIGVKGLSTMNNIDEMPPICHDCPYWEVCEEPYICQIDTQVNSDYKSKQNKGEI